MRSAAAPALALALATGLAAAQDERLYTQPGWELGAQLSRYEYEEPDFMELEGNRGGMPAAYTFTSATRLFFRLEARLSHGRLDYRGSGTLEDVPDWLAEARAVAGRDFALGRAVVSPYAGIAFRYLYNDLRGTTSTGHRGYQRVSRYGYLPLGATLRIPLGERTALAPSFEYHAFFRGTQESYLGDTGIPGINDVNNTQKHGRGWRAALMLEAGRWALGPWVHYWRIEDSEVEPIGAGLGGLEPENETREYGVELRYRF